MIFVDNSLLLDQKVYAAESANSETVLLDFNYIPIKSNRLLSI